MNPDIMNWVILGGFVVVFYLFFIRPQQTKAKEGKAFLEELKKGDKVVTVGGIHGRILKDDGATYLLEVDTNAKIRIDKASISMDATKAALNPQESAEK